MNKYTLPTNTIINGIACEFNTDFRDILQIFKALNDPDLLEGEKIQVALYLFYKDDNYKCNIDKAIEEMFNFITVCEDEPDTPQQKSKPLYDWEQDFNLIVSPVNRIIGTDIRSLEYLHWWTFLSAFMEIGECTFNTYVGIRDKLNRHQKLEKYEKKIYEEHKNAIILKKKYDSTTQSIIDEIMGKGV